MIRRHFSRHVVYERGGAVHAVCGIIAAFRGFIRQRFLMLGVVGGHYGKPRVLQAVLRHPEQLADFVHRRRDVLRRAVVTCSGLFRKPHFFLFGGVAFLFGQVTFAAHDVQHQIAPFRRAFYAVFRGVARRVFEYAGKGRRLRRGEAVGRTAEIYSAGLVDAVRARAEIYDGEIHRKYLVL